MRILVRKLSRNDNNEQFRELQKNFLEKMDSFDSNFSEGTYIFDTYDSDDEDICFIALKDKKILGYAELYFEDEYYENRQTYIISGIYVLEEYQGYGIGALLIQNIKEYAQENNINILYGSVLPGNDDARRFLENQSFEKCSSESYVMKIRQK